MLHQAISWIYKTINKSVKVLQDHVFTFDVFTHNKVYFQVYVNSIQKNIFFKKNARPKFPSD